jgi:hypothetical protein
MVGIAAAMQIVASVKPHPGELLGVEVP